MRRPVRQGRGFQSGGGAGLNVSPTFLVVSHAVSQQAAELVAIEMQEAQLVPERGFLQDAGDDSADAVLRYGQPESQGQGRGQVDLLHHCRLLQSSFKNKREPS